jgi:gp16 family phage-associated protein
LPVHFKWIMMSTNIHKCTTKYTKMASIAPEKTPEQVKEEFARKGISIRSWALANDFAPSLVYEILSGRKRTCARGQSHKIAVRLGLKKGVITNSVRNAI